MRSRLRLDGASPLAISAILFGGFLALRWPFRSEYLINWDSVQFALGAESFNLEAHQPHPPGYIGYVALGRLLSTVVGDVPGALTLISVVSGAVAPVGLFLLARRMLPTSYALTAAVLFGLSPMLWYYSEVALTYAPEVALSIFFALFVHRARAMRSLPDLIAMTLSFAVLGSLRQSAMVLLAPLWLIAVWRFPLRTQIGATALLGIACLTWLVPLLWASGGPAAYLQESRALAELTGGRTSIVTGHLLGVMQNVAIIAVGIAVGMHATLVVLALARRRRGGSLGALRRSDRRFLLAWVIVPVLLYVLGHTGQPGYTLLLLPAGYLWVGSAVAQMVREPERAGEAASHAPPQPSVSRRLAPIFGVLAVKAVVAFFAVPRLTYVLVASEAGASVQQWAALPSPADRTAVHMTEVPTQSPLAQAVRQFSIGHHDAYWGEMIDFIQVFPPERTVVLTGIGGPLISGSFRQLGYYLTDYRVYGVGWDRSNEFGHLFRAYEGETTYRLERLETASDVLMLPAGARWLLIPDADVAAQLDSSIVRVTRELGHGATITVAHVANGQVLEFHTDEEQAEIRLR